MKKIEQYFEINKDILDTMEPEEGHFLRFQEKLGKRKTNAISWTFRIAATLLLAAFVSASLLYFHSQTHDYMSAELRETAYFYNLQSESLLVEIQNSSTINSSEKQVILNDVRNFEKEYNSLLSDLKKYPEDERLVNAFINYHRSRVEFLEGIVNQIKSTGNFTI